MVWGSELVDWAAVTAEIYVAPLGRRWDHVRAVADKATLIAKSFGSDDGHLLVAAAYLHDVGYASELAATGFHPLDGGRFVRTAGYERLAELVAHHSAARVEAVLRGIDGYEDEFSFADDELDQALTYCDLTTSPNGQPIKLADRVAEINLRYGRDHVTARAITLGVPEFERAVAATEARLESVSF